MDDNQKFEYVSGETIQNVIIAIFVRINDGLGMLKDATSLKDTYKFLRTIGLLFLVACLSSIFSDFILLWIGKYSVEY